MPYMKKLSVAVKYVKPKNNPIITAEMGIVRSKVYKRIFKDEFKNYKYKDYDYDLSSLKTNKQKDYNFSFLPCFLFSFYVNLYFTQFTNVKKTLRR